MSDSTAEGSEACEKKIDQQSGDELLQAYLEMGRNRDLCGQRFRELTETLRALSEELKRRKMKAPFSWKVTGQRGSAKEREHEFEASPFSDFEAFRRALPQWSEAKCQYFHQQAGAYSTLKGGRYTDWIRAVVNWDSRSPQQWSRASAYFRPIALSVQPPAPDERSHIRGGERGLGSTNERGKISIDAEAVGGANLSRDESAGSGLPGVSFGFDNIKDALFG